jgi:hypothetical protein
VSSAWWVFLGRDFAHALFVWFSFFFRMATNRIITIAIITVLVLLILAVVFSKFH